jgi:Phosphate-induced protein 1 conserved region
MNKFVAFVVSTVFLALTTVNVFAQPEVIKHKGNPHNQIAAAPTAGGTTALSAMNYANGQLIYQPVIYLIWYGNWNQTNGSDNAGGQQIIREWANGIGGSAHYALNSSLSVTNYPISGSAVYGGETTDTGTSTRLSDANIQSIVSKSITSGRLPNNPNGVYFVITSSNVNESSGFCTQYCGWHTSATISGIGKVRYSFVGNANRCITSCAAQSVSPNGNAGVDGAVSVLTHELEEANTDPDPRSGWTDSSGAENGDKCAWTFGTTLTKLASGAFYNMSFGGRNWLIQRNILKSGTTFDCRVDATHQ